MIVRVKDKNINNYIEGEIFDLTKTETKVVSLNYGISKEFNITDIEVKINNKWTKLKELI